MVFPISFSINRFRYQGMHFSHTLLKKGKGLQSGLVCIFFIFELTIDAHWILWLKVYGVIVRCIICTSAVLQMLPSSVQSIQCDCVYHSLYFIITIFMNHHNDLKVTNICLYV